MLIAILYFTSVACLCVICQFLSLWLLHIIKANYIITDNLIDIFLTSDTTLLFHVGKKTYEWTSLCTFNLPRLRKRKSMPLLQQVVIELVFPTA